jgi:hypothetical protein
MKIESIGVPARTLLTFAEEHPAWTEGWAGPNADEARGALVRLFPPAAASEERIASVARALEAAGAARVKIVSRETPPDVVRRIVDDPSRSEASHREVVVRMADEARSRDRGALKALLDEVMTEEGL